MELIKIRKNFQVTIPQSLRRLIHLAEGDLVEAEVKNGALVIRPVKVVHTVQEYYYTKEWQAKEAGNDADIAAGKIIGPIISINEGKALLDHVKEPETENDGFNRSAGSWQGLIDPDELIAEIYAHRSISFRPKVEL
jgi:AbrB family looped-hinge helix DNA binding protein